jgi:hypothetical protein
MRYLLTVFLALSAFPLSSCSPTLRPVITVTPANLSQSGVLQPGNYIFQVSDMLTVANDPPIVPPGSYTSTASFNAVLSFTLP